MIKLAEVIKRLASEKIDVNPLYSKNPTSEARSYYKNTKFRKKMDQYDEFYCFTTILSKDYLLKGYALYESLLNQTEAFHLWICCMDHESLEELKKLDLSNVSLIPVWEVEQNLLNQINHNRTMKECCATMKAPLCKHILDNYRELDHIVYCDADMYFFSDPKAIFEQWANYSVFLCTTRTTELHTNNHGLYQSGLIGFKQESNSKHILSWWRDHCVDWCYNTLLDEEDRWLDQKYLNDIPNQFENIKIMDHIGINVAPWNLLFMDIDHYKTSKQKNKHFYKRDTINMF